MARQFKTISPLRAPLDHVDGTRTEGAACERVLVHGERDVGLRLRSGARAMFANASEGDQAALGGNASGLHIFSGDIDRDMAARASIGGAEDHVAIKATAPLQLTENAHIELLAPSGAYFRISVGNDGRLTAAPAPELAAPGKGPPAARSTMFVNTSILVMLADSATIEDSDS